MSYILNIETTAEICSIALSDDDKLLSLKESEISRSHSKLATVLISEALKEHSLSVASLSAVAISKGPGSYTGLRIGTSIAKGLCFSHELPLIAIDTLQIMAYQFLQNHTLTHKYIAPFLIARGEEVYTAIYDKDLNTILPPCIKVIDEDIFDDLIDKDILLVGSPLNNEPALSFINIHIYKFEYSSKYMPFLSFKNYLQSVYADLTYFNPLYLKGFKPITPVSK